MPSLDTLASRLPVRTISMFVHELDVDPHLVAEVLAESGQHLLEDVVGVAAALDDVERHRAALVLDDLEALDRVVELLEIVREEGRRAGTGRPCPE